MARILDSYARESRRRRKGHRYVSVAGQHQVNKQRIADLGATLGKELQDEGKSAWNARIDRPGFEEIVSRLESGESQGVVIFDIARFLRLVETAVRIVKLAERGAERGFRIYDAGMEYDLMTPSGRNAFYDKARSAELYSHEQQHKANRGLRQKAERGEGRIGTRRAFGFERVVVKDDEGDEVITIRPYAPEVPHIRKIAEMYVANKWNWRDACDYLTDQGIATSTGIPWTSSSISRAMTAPRMAGYTVKGGEIMGQLPGEPILNPIVWQQIVARIKPRGRPPVDRFQCSGIVRCGNCGQGISCGKNSNGRTRPNGNFKYQYACRVNGKGCLKNIADQLALDAIVSQLAIVWLSDATNIEQLREQAEARKRERHPHEEEIGRIEGLILTWDKRLADGAIDEIRHRRMMKDLEPRLKLEQAKLTGIDSAPPIPDEELIINAEERWEAMDLRARREQLKKISATKVIVCRPGSVMDGIDTLTGRVWMESRTEFLARHGLEK